MKAKGSLILIVMILIALLAIVAAIAAFTIPNLNENQKAANDNAAQAMLKSIVTAQATYCTMHKQYAPSLAVLTKAGLLNRIEFTACTSPGKNSKAFNGFVFQMTAGRAWTKMSFYVRCKPAANSSGRNCYAVDYCGKIITTQEY
jgi:competence protein ComGC